MDIEHVITNGTIVDGTSQPRYRTDVGINDGRKGITTLVAGQCGFSPAPVIDRSIPWVDGFSEGLRECAFMTDTIMTRRGKANPASYGTLPVIRMQRHRASKLC